jgi:hypothetical protein
MSLRSATHRLEGHVLSKAGLSYLLGQVDQARPVCADRNIERSAKGIKTVSDRIIPEIFDRGWSAIADGMLSKEGASCAILAACASKLI